MGELLSLEAIEHRFPDQWVLLADPVWDGDIDLVAGRVVFHSDDREAVWERDRELGMKEFAVLYMGSALPRDQDGFLL